MPEPPADVIEDAVAALREDGDEGTLALFLPYGLPAQQRAALLHSVGSLCQAVRRRGVPAHVLRVAGQDLERRGFDTGGQLEAVYILYTGDRPQLPPEAD